MMLSPEAPHALRNFLDDHGRIAQWPSKRKLQLVALGWLADRFEPGREYYEKEVGAILEGLHAFNDRAMLRRDLCDLGYLARAADGSKYWRTDKVVPESAGGD